MGYKLLQSALLVLLIHTHVFAQHDPGYMKEPQGDRRSVGMLLYEHAIVSDYGMPMEAFRVADMGAAFEVFTIGLSEEPVSPMGGIYGSIKPSRTIDDVSKLDVLVVPGGNWKLLRDDDRFHRWLRKLADGGTIIMSVCSGGYVLAQGGLLEDRDVTGLTLQLDMLQEFAPTARIHPHRRFVVDGNIVTTAGGATGIDGALEVIRRLAGEDTAGWVAASYLDYWAWNSDPETAE